MVVLVTKNLNPVQVIILLLILFLNGFLIISVKMQNSQNLNPVAALPLVVVLAAIPMVTPMIKVLPL